MTPTRLQAIRLNLRNVQVVAQAMDRIGNTPKVTGYYVADVADLLTLWDTHQTALRALVERMTRAVDGTEAALSVQAYRDELERLLTPEQS